MVLRLDRPLRLSVRAPRRRLAARAGPALRAQPAVGVRRRRGDARLQPAGARAGPRPRRRRVPDRQRGDPRPPGRAAQGPSAPCCPSAARSRRDALQTVALATGVGDKAVAIAYERRKPADKVDETWIARCRGQQAGALGALETARMRPASPAPLGSCNPRSRSPPCWDMCACGSPRRFRLAAIRRWRRCRPAPRPTPPSWPAGRAGGDRRTARGGPRRAFALGKAASKAARPEAREFEASANQRYRGSRHARLLRS